MRPQRIHNIDAGVDYSRALSFSRRTTFSFSTGSAVLVRDKALGGFDGNRTSYQFIGNADSTATVSDPVLANNGAVVIPAGARVEGEVAESEDEKTLAALKDKPKLSLRFRDVVLPSGQTLPLTATLVSVHDNSGKNSEKSNYRRPKRSGPIRQIFQHDWSGQRGGVSAARSRVWLLAHFPAEAT